MLRLACRIMFLENLPVPWTGLMKRIRKPHCDEKLFLVTR